MTWRFGAVPYGVTGGLRDALRDEGTVMARPVRVEYAGALYHVMNRANRRERVFRTVAEYGMPPYVLRSRRCRRREAWDLAMYLAGRYCRAGTSRSALAREMEMSLSGFVHACERVHRHLAVRRHPLHARLEAVLKRVGDAGK